MLGALTHPHEGGIRSGPRLVACAAGLLLIASGLIHISAAADHKDLPLMMWGFLGVACLQAGLGGLLLVRRPGGLLVAAGIALTAGSIGVWLVSRTIGLEFLGAEAQEPIGFKDGVCILFEIGTLPALALLASRDLLALSLPSARLGSQALGVLGAGVFALFVPALMLDGGDHHTHEEAEALAHDHHGGAEEAESGHRHGELAAAAESAHAHPVAGHADAGLAPASAGGHDHLAAAALPGGHEHAAATPHGHGGTRGRSHRGHQHAGGSPGTGHKHSHGRGGSGGGHTHGGTEHAAEGHQHPEAGAAGHDHGDEPQGWSATWKDPERAANGQPARGAALVFRTPSNEAANGPGHSHSEACNPTPEQRAAADDLYRRTAAALKKYENNPAQAYLDGFWYQFGPTDRMIHMVNPGRVDDPTILDPNEIESFIYVMTDRGYMPVGGMYIMPEYGMHGPQPGGCLTQWHHHGGLVGRAATAGTREDTPEMLHVWTYPGLDPWGHYNGREMSQLFTPGSQVPSVCRDSGDAMDGCLP